MRAKVEEIVGVSTSSPGGPAPFTPRAKKVLELALREALQRNHSYIGTEHILLGLVQEGHGVAVTVLTESRGGSRPGAPGRRQPMTSGPEAPTVRPFEQPTGTMSPTWPPGEPSCPRCGANLSQSARFRAMDVPADTGSADPISVYVVYCLSCGTTLHMLQARRPELGTRWEMAGGSAQYFGYDVDRRYLPVLLPFLLRPSRDGVTLTDDGLFVATFGLVKVTTPRTNVTGAHITEDYRWWTAVGIRMSMADDGLTFGTNNRRGVCVHFDEKVRSSLRRQRPFGADGDRG